MCLFVLNTLPHMVSGKKTDYLWGKTIVEELLSTVLSVEARVFPMSSLRTMHLFSKMHPIIFTVQVTHYFLTLSLANSTFDQLKIWPLLFHEADEIFTTSRSRNVKLQSNNPKCNLASLLCLKLLFLYEFKHQCLNIVYVWVTKFS